MSAEPYVYEAERVGAFAHVRGLTPLMAGFALAVGVAWPNGGYFPTTWGWAALVLLVAAACCFAFRRTIAISGREKLFVALLAGFVGWVALSTAWSQSVPATVHEVERSLVYVAAAVLLVALLERRSVGILLAGTLAGITCVSVYSLGTRLFPEQLGSFDPVAGYRLATPIGYWNGLGLYCAMGILLALGLAARHAPRQGRALAAATVPVNATVLFFTFSRGAWCALIVGFLAMIVLERERLRLAAAAAVLVPASALAILLATHERALTDRSASLSLASREGHRLAPAVALLTIASALCVLGLAALQRRVRLGRRTARAIGIGLVLAMVCAVGALIAVKGGTGRIAHSLASGFTAKQAADHQNNLSGRILTVSSNGRIELWSKALDDAKAHPFLGSGAGTYEQFFLAHRNEGSWSARNAHNLYLETLAELGPVGLLVLALALSLPLAAAWRARGDGMAVAAAGVYVAYLMHAAWDWDWQLPAVTLVALTAAAALFARARGTSARRLSGRVRLALAAALLAPAAFAAVVAIGNYESSVATRDAAAGNWPAAAKHARLAARLTPWATEPQRTLAQTQLASGDFDRAAATLRHAIARDPRNQALWLDLAIATTGFEHALALRHWRSLDPLSPLTVR